MLIGLLWHWILAEIFPFRKLSPWTSYSIREHWLPFFSVSKVYALENLSNDFLAKMYFDFRKCVPWTSYMDIHNHRWLINVQSQSWQALQVEKFYWDWSFFLSLMCSSWFDVLENEIPNAITGWLETQCCQHCPSHIMESEIRGNRIGCLYTWHSVMAPNSHIVSHNWPLVWLRPG